MTIFQLFTKKYKDLFNFCLWQEYSEINIQIYYIWMLDFIWDVQIFLSIVLNKDRILNSSKLDNLIISDCQLNSKSVTYHHYITHRMKIFLVGDYRKCT